MAEGVLEAAEGGEEGAEPIEGFEARGTGVNKFVYWVCNSPLGEWTQLPDLNPNDIPNARSIKFYFSGDLDANICTNPFFYQTEKVYLRAQIARIAHSTTLVQAGSYKFTEETNEREIEVNAPEEPAEGEAVIPPPNAKDLSDLRKWVHFTPSILQ